MSNNQRSVTLENVNDHPDPGVGAPRAPRPARDQLIVLMIVTLVVRLVYVLGAWLVTRDPAVFIEQDSESYLAPARDLLARGTFTADGAPDLQRTPGYPLMLVVGLWLGYPIAITISLQLLLSVVTSLGIFVLARDLTGDRRVGLIAIAVYAFEPLAIRQTVALGTETLFTTFVVWALVSMVRYAGGAKPLALIASTALLAVAAYVRPAGYYLAFGLVGFLALVAIARRDWRRLAHAALAVIVGVAIVLPWVRRNRALDYPGFSAIAAVNMYFYNAAAVEATKEGKSYLDVQTALGYRDARVYAQQHPEQVSWSPGRRFTYMRAEGSRIVRENLAVYARLHIAGMLRVLLDPGALALLEPYGLYVGNTGVIGIVVTKGLIAGVRRILETNPLGFLLLVVLGALLAVIYGFAIRGWLTGGRRRDPATWLLVLTIAYFITVAGGPVGVGRFRHPAMPFVCVLAAIGIASVRRGRARERVHDAG